MAIPAAVCLYTHSQARADTPPFQGAAESACWESTQDFCSADHSVSMALRSGMGEYLFHIKVGNYVFRR